MEAPMMARVLSLAILAGFALACGPVPGGSLSGEVRPPPATWSGALDDDKAFCEIESRPADPHSIQLECFVRDGGLYAQSHRWALAPWWPVTSWAAIWLEHPDVRVRIDGAIYEVRAEQVTDADVREPTLAARGYDPVPDGIVLFRFVPRG
jgi:hypothetical protein